MSSVPTEPRLWSLRGRLIKLFAAGGFAAWLASGALVLVLAERENADDWDLSLERNARIVLRLAQHEFEETGGSLADLQGNAPLAFPGLMIQVRNAAGQLLLKTAEAPDVPFTGVLGQFHDIRLASGEWRVTALRDAASGLVVQLADSTTQRRREFLQLDAALLVPILIVLPLIMVVAGLLATRVLRPLRHAARHLSERGSTDLSPIQAGELPQEVLPLVDAFNQLLRRLAESWEEERRFAASVAHELRTPLAGIRLNLQRLQQADHTTVPPDLPRLLIGAVDRANRVIEQLLTLARLERGLGPASALELVELPRIIAETLDEFALRAAERGIRFEVQAATPVLRAPSQALYLVLRNFVENALRYSPRDAVILISAGVEASHWWMQVEDGGAGLTPAGFADRNQLATLSTENLQIGLTLVGRIATLLGGRLDSGSSTRLGGARFRFSAPLEPLSIGIDDAA